MITIDRQYCTTPLICLLGYSCFLLLPYQSIYSIFNNIYILLNNKSHRNCNYQVRHIRTWPDRRSTIWILKIRPARYRSRNVVRLESIGNGTGSSKEERQQQFSQYMIIIYRPEVSAVTEGRAAFHPVGGVARTGHRRHRYDALLTRAAGADILRRQAHIAGVLVVYDICLCDSTLSSYWTIYSNGKVVSRG
jgi:hypothetical protein